MNDTEVRVTGFGGQGVVLLAYVIGRATAINAGRHSTMIQSFGPEARGSTCSATLVISDREVLYPYIRRPDVLVVMSNEAYEKYHDELKPGGILVYENSLVHPEPRPGDLLAVPATGAYTLGLGSTYNGVPRPAVVLVADGEAAVIRRRETVEELLRYET